MNRTISVANFIRVIRNFDQKLTPYTEDHSQRTCDEAVMLGAEYGLNKMDMEYLRVGALIHDCGKLFINTDIIYKAGKLSEAEYAAVKQHSRLAAEALEPAGLPSEVMGIIRHHHEHFDGTGYPDKLQGVGIPLLARMVCIADVWDALNSDRPYRTKYDSAKALGIMADISSIFDPDLFTLFLDLKRRGSG